MTGCLCGVRYKFQSKEDTDRWNTHSSNTRRCLHDAIIKTIDIWHLSEAQTTLDCSLSNVIFNQLSLYWIMRATIGI